MAFLARSSIFSSQDGSRHRSPLSPIWKFVMGCGFNNRANSVALLHGGFERRDGAVVESLRNADEIGSSEFAHSVERFDRDGGFGHTASVFARLQGISDDALVATDRRLNFRAPVVAGRLLPVHAPVRIDRENMLVSLGWRSRGRWPSHGSFAWRHDEFSVRISRQNAFEIASPVISAVAHE